MTMNPMSCEAFHGRLMAYLEEETDAVTRAAVERHAVTCVECGALLADMRKLRNDAANLPALAPSRDLWSGIAARIEAPVVPIGHQAATGGRRATRRVWQAGLLAASLAGAASLGYFAGNRPVALEPVQVAQDVPDSVTLEPANPAQSPETRVASAPPSASRPAATPAAAPASTSVPASAPYGAQLVVANLTADYDREVARLSTLLENRRNQLDPVTVAIIERNLQIIDAAIADSKQAIARDPASRFLIETLNQSLQVKVELMRTAALLPSRT